MQTLVELLEMAKKASADHAATLAKLEQSRTEAKNEAEKANAEAAAALASGDQKSYQTAKYNENYHRERLNFLENQKVAEHFTPDQHNAIIDDVNKAAGNELRPLYTHLWELADEWDDTISKINAVLTETHKISRILHQMLSDKARSGRTLANYNFPMYSMSTSHVLERLFYSDGSSGAYSALRVNCGEKPKKKGR